jgi:hypothetical protein
MKHPSISSHTFFPTSAPFDRLYEKKSNISSELLPTCFGGDCLLGDLEAAICFCGLVVVLEGKCGERRV